MAEPLVKRKVLVSPPPSLGKGGRGGFSVLFRERENQNSPALWRKGGEGGHLKTLSISFFSVTEKEERPFPPSLETKKRR